MAQRPEWILLPKPLGLSRSSAKTFVRVAGELASAKRTNFTADGRSGAALRAALHVLTDLVDQGWRVRVDKADQVAVRPPSEAKDPLREKARVRKQELIKRDEQLATPSVRRFVEEMERPHEFQGRFVSIFSLMRDGGELRNALEAVEREDVSASNLRTAINPYVQVVEPTERCIHTGFRLGDIWRYFRHTWSNQYTSTPGRTMLLLVRDQAVPFHPVIGIAALGSPIVQIRERDEWIGWQSAQFARSVEENPSIRMARWICDRMDVCA